MKIRAQTPKRYFILSLSSLSSSYSRPSPPRHRSWVVAQGQMKRGEIITIYYYIGWKCNLPYDKPNARTPLCPSFRSITPRTIPSLRRGSPRPSRQRREKGIKIWIQREQGGGNNPRGDFATRRNVITLLVVHRPASLQQRERVEGERRV